MQWEIVSSEMKWGETFSLWNESSSKYSGARNIKDRMTRISLADKALLWNLICSWDLDESKKSSDSSFVNFLFNDLF